MEAAEASSFESSEMLATYLGSTPLLSESWKLCGHANAGGADAGTSFVINDIGGVTYIAFPSVPSVADLNAACSNLLVELDGAAPPPLFSALRPHRPVMVHDGFLHLFLSLLKSSDFQLQMSEILKQSKSVVFTGHSVGGTTASLAALWLLSSLQSRSSPSNINVLCITFGSPLLGNESLSRAILQERWAGNFCHVVAKHDIVPRLLFADLSPIASQLNSLLHYWHFSMASTFLRELGVQLSDDDRNNFFNSVLNDTKASAKRGEDDGSAMNSFWPFGSYMFCTNEGAVCLDNAMAVVKLLHLMLSTGNATSSIEDHLNYQVYVGKASSQFLMSRGLIEGDFSHSSYEAGVTLALQSSGIATCEATSGAAKDCLRMAKRMGRTPNLNSATLAINLSKITPLRAQIEWYKASCEESDDRMGYYDTFKLRGASKRDARVNMNRIKLARFWDSIILMLETNQLPLNFHKRAKWVNASHFYQLLVEPLDIAEYYRKGTHRTQGHYLKHGRERRYEIFDRWWRNREVGEEENTRRSSFASLTQDSSFWARVEEAREWLEDTRSETDSRKLALLWENINDFEKYARTIIERKEVSRDVLAENSSYSLWIKEWGEVKSQQKQKQQQQHFPSQLPGFFEGKVVP